MCARVRAYDDRKFTSPKLSFLCEEEGNLFLFLVHSDDVLHQNTHTHKHGRAGRQALFEFSNFLGEFGGTNPA